MERVLSGELGHVFVTSNTRRFQRLARYIFFLPTHKVNAERKLVRCSFFRTNIVYTDFGIWNTPTVSRFRVGFVLNLTITPGGGCRGPKGRIQEKARHEISQGRPSISCWKARQISEEWQICQEGWDWCPHFSCSCA